MYHLAPEVVARVGVGGGTSKYREFVEATTSAITNPDADGTSPVRGISRTVPQQPTRTGKPAPGVASWDINPADPSEAIRDLKAAAVAGAERFFQEDEGVVNEVFESTLGANTTTVAVDTNGLVTLAKKGTGDGRDSAGTNLLPKAPWDRARILVIGTTALFLEDFDTDDDNTIEASYLGPVANNAVVPVTPGTALDAAIAATDSWKVVEYAIRREFSGRLQARPGHSTSADARSTTISLQLQAFETETYLLPA